MKKDYFRPLTAPNSEDRITVGTCTGEVFSSPDHPSIVSVMLVVNANPGNGHFSKWMDEFARRAHAHGKRELWFPTPSLPCVSGVLKWCKANGHRPKMAVEPHPNGDTCAILKVKI